MLTNQLQVRVLAELAKGNNNYEKITKNLNISKSWLSEIITELEKKQFITKERQGLKLNINISEASFAQAIKHLFYKVNYIDFENFLFGLKFRILSCSLFSWKTSNEISNQLNVPVKSVRNTLSLLQNQGLITRESRTIMFNKKAWPELYAFLEKYRNFSQIQGNLLWKFEEEQIFEVLEEKQIQGSMTGFSRYNDFGITLFETKICCHLPKKDLSKEEIFIHSLLQIDDSRMTGLAVIFFKKHKLKNPDELAVKYDCLDRLEDIKKIMQGKEAVMLPHISEQKLKDLMEVYNVK